MFEKVKEVLMEAINVDEDMIKMEANLKDDLGIDSLAAVELSLELETEFDVRIEDEAGKAGYRSRYRKPAGKQSVNKRKAKIPWLF